MLINFHKYHALWNDFVVLDQAANRRLSRERLPALARAICDPRTGIGADGILWLSSGRKADCRMDVYNADGGWAEKSGNGLRITAVHLKSTHPTRRHFEIQTGTSVDRTSMLKKIAGGYVVRTELGQPEFEAASLPMKSRSKYVINRSVKIGKNNIWMTCLKVGNPHAVVFVDDFEFEWKVLGAEIETARNFPRGTNVEFVKVVNRTHLKLAEWERGAGATGSSGTGASAAVCAAVVLGLAERDCRVEFEAGELQVVWRADNLVELTGPVQFIMRGEFDYR
jgi:diaminopimelate epimerase